MPLYVRTGSILPFDPVRQFTAEKIEGPLSVSIYPGANTSFLLYQDDGTSFNYRKGEWMGLKMARDDARQRLSLEPLPGSRRWPPGPRSVAVQLGEATRNITFEGKPIEVSF